MIKRYSKKVNESISRTRKFVKKNESLDSQTLRNIEDGKDQIQDVIYDILGDAEDLADAEILKQCEIIKKACAKINTRIWRLQDSLD